MLFNNHFNNGVISITAVLVTLPIQAVASNFSACTNNTITLPGSSGPEIWSCIAGNSPIPPVDAVSIDSNNIQASAKESETTVSVQKRTNASSEVMKEEITDVLDQPTIENKRKFLANYSVGLQYATNRKDEGLRESRDRSVVLPVLSLIHI